MRPLLLVLLLACSAAVLAEDVVLTEITPESVTALMNEYRAQAGLLPLRLDSKLTRAAEGRMQEMADGGWWSHQSPEGTSPFVWLSIIDYKYSMAAENLATGFETVRLLVETWMESPGHRANILGGGYADCGVAVLDGSTTGPALGRAVVVLFGRRLAQTVAAR